MGRRLLALLLIAALVALASAKSYSVPEAVSDITINPDSSFDVVETYRYSFDGSFTAVDRVIYLDRIDDISGIGVFEGSTPLRFEVDRGSGQVMVTWHYSATDEEKVFTLRYRVHGGISYYSDVDSFFWKAMPADRDVALGKVKVIVHFPAAVDINATETKLYSNAQNQKTYFMDSRTLVFEGENSPVGDDFEVGAAMPKGMVAETFSWKRFFSEVVFPLLVPAIPMATLLVMLLLYFKFGRDAPAAFSAYRMTAPPDDLEPGLVGTLFDESADNRDVMATIYDLARRGHVEIVETQTEGSGLLFRTSRDYEFVLKKELSDPGLKPFEKLTLEVLFRGMAAGSRVKVSNLQKDTGAQRRIASVAKEFYREAVARGFFPEDPGATRNRYVGIGALVCAIPVVLFFCGGCSWLPEGDAICGAVSVFLSGIIVIAISNWMPRRTQAGADEKAKWAAFKRYLDELSAFKSTPEGKGLFEKFYPYAIVFGIEGGVTSAFEKAGADMPIWFIPYFAGRHTRIGGIASGTGVGGVGGLGSFKASMGSLQSATNRFYSALNTAASGGRRGGGGFRSGGSFHGGGGFRGGGGGGGGGMRAR